MKDDIILTVMLIMALIFITVAFKESAEKESRFSLLSSELTVYKSRCTLLEKENARLNALVPLEEDKSYDQGGEK